MKKTKFYGLISIIWVLLIIFMVGKAMPVEATATPTLALQLELESNSSSSPIKYFDTSGNNNHATCYALNNNCPGYLDIGIKPGFNALGFSGLGEHIRVNNSASLQIQDAITLQSWVRPNFNTSSYYYQVVINKGNDFELGIFKQGNIRVVLTSASGTQKIVKSSANIIKSNVWQHVAATYDGNQIKLFVNGNLVASDIMTGQIRTIKSQMYIGSFYGHYFFDGFMDHLEVYNGALSDSEIFNSFKKQTDNLIIHLKLDEDLGVFDFAFYDSSVFANHAVNGPSTSYPSMIGSQCVINDCRLFNGTSNYLKVMNSPSLKVKDQITISSWIKADPSLQSDSQSFILNKGDDYQLGIMKDGRVFGRIVGNGIASKVVKSAPGVFSSSTWNLVALTYDGSVANVFLNGLVVASSTFTGSIRQGNTNLFIGQFTNHYFLKGTLDEIKVYDRALSEGEILSYYNKTKPTSLVVVQSGKLTCAKDSAMGDVSVDINSYPIIGQFICSADTVEDIYLNSVTVDFTTGTPSGLANTNYQYLQAYDASQTVVSTYSLYSVASTSNKFVFPTPLTIKANSNVVIRVVAHTTSGAIGSLVTGLSGYSYIGKTSGITVDDNSCVSGQNVTINELTKVTKDASYGDQKVTAGTANVKIGQYEVEFLDDVKSTYFKIDLGGTGFPGMIDNISIRQQKPLVNGEDYFWVGLNSASSTQIISGGYPFKKGKVILEIYADISSTTSAGQYITTNLSMGGSKTYSLYSSSALSVAKGQTITVFQPPSLTIVQNNFASWIVSSDSNFESIVRLSLMADADLMVKKMTFKLFSADPTYWSVGQLANNFNKFYLYNYPTKLAEAVVNPIDGTISFTGFNLSLAPGNQSLQVFASTASSDSMIPSSLASVRVVFDNPTDLVVSSTSQGLLSQNQISVLYYDAKYDYLLYAGSYPRVDYNYSSYDSEVPRTPSASDNLYEFTITNSGDAELELNKIVFRINADVVLPSTTTPHSYSTIDQYAIPNINNIILTDKFGSLIATGTTSIMTSTQTWSQYKDRYMYVEFNQPSQLLSAHVTKKYILKGDTTGIRNGLKPDEVVSLWIETPGRTGYDSSDTNSTDEKYWQSTAWNYSYTPKANYPKQTNLSALNTLMGMGYTY